MEMFIVIIKQITMMFFIVTLGYIAYKKKIITTKGTKEMSNVLFWICNPCIMATTYNIPFDIKKLGELGFTFILSCSAIFISLIIAKLIFKDKFRLEQLAIGFSNVGFMGIPLVTGIFGPEAVFYISAYIVAFNIMAWSIGIYLISGDKKLVNIGSMIKNPGVLSLAVGLLVFISPVKLPEIIYKSCSSVGGLNTALSMLVLGCYIADGPLLDIFSNKKAYLVSFVRLIVSPLILLALLSLLPSSLYTIKMVVLIASSTPAAVMVAMFAQNHDKDFSYAARIVSLSTILCFVTIPVIVTLAQMLWGI